MDGHLLIVGILVLQFLLDVLDGCPRLIFFLSKYIGEVHHIIEFAPCLYALIELLSRNQAKSHRAEEIQNCLFGECVLLVFSLEEEGDLMFGMFEHEFCHF